MVQSTKYVTWSPQRLDHFISLLIRFFTSDSGFCILGTPMGFRSFVELFVVEVFYNVSISRYFVEYVEFDICTIDMLESYLVRNLLVVLLITYLIVRPLFLFFRVSSTSLL